MKRLWSVLGIALSRRTFEKDMSEELRMHIEEYTDELVCRGIPRDEAMRQARLEFGEVNTVKAECQQARGLLILDLLLREIRHAGRFFRKTPGLTATALLTLAICIGANLTIFAVVDSVLLRPLPFPDSDRLVTIFNTYPKAGVERDGASTTNYYERRGHIAAFQSVSIYRLVNAIVGEPGAAERREIGEVSPDFFATLGSGPAMGRSFTEAETYFGRNDVAILSDSYWREHFQANRDVLGRRVRLDGRSLTVVGILPAGFRFLSSEACLYRPFASSLQTRGASERHSGGNVTQMIARLRPGATITEAQAQIDSQNNALELDDPQAKMIADAGFRSMVVSLHGDHVAAIRPVVLLLQAGVLVLLLICLVNLANLLLIRANSRVKELAVRQALGASGRQILAEVVIETTLLTVAGGVLGILMADGGIRLLSAFGATHLPLGGQIGFNLRLALVGVAASILAGIVLAVPIVWFCLSQNVEDALKSEGRSGTAGHKAQRWGHGFTVAQIALSFVLLAGAGLLGLGLKHAMGVSPGFEVEHALSAQTSLVGNNYPSAAAALRFVETLTAELERQPGVALAGVVNNIPFSGRSGKSSAYVVGHELRPGESPRGHYSYGVGGDYFRAMGYRLWDGRFLDGTDSQRGRRVCVVDKDFADYYWPGRSAIGQHLFEGASKGPDPEAFTVVGVVSSTKQAGLTDEAAQGAVYYPYLFHADNNIFLIVRSRVTEGALAPVLRRVVARVDPELAVYDVRTMDARISDSLVTRRSPALLAMLFSVIALLLTAIGIYGVLSYAVVQRRREIGVRMAVGARPEQIGWHFLGLALRLLAIGCVVGSLGAWVSGRAMQSVLFHVGSFDPAMLATTGAIVSIVGFGACWLPARRAAKTSPREAMSD